jgi:hypothetical protein
MPKGQMKQLSKDEFVAQAKGKVESVRKSGGALTSLATLLERAPDFSTALLDEVRASREKAEASARELKELESQMLLRGRTFAHEQFESTLAALKK